MIVVLNGYPGVGKLTIAQALVEKLGARLLDIHSVYNIAFALTAFRSPEFRGAVERIEAIAHELVLNLPPDVPVVLTTVLAGESEWGDAEWARMESLGDRRPPFCVVHVHCDLGENIRRIEDAGRGAKRKPRDPDMARRNHAEAKALLGADAPHFLRLDVTALSQDRAAQQITDWLQTIG